MDNITETEKPTIAGADALEALQREQEAEAVAVTSAVIDQKADEAQATMSAEAEEAAARAGAAFAVGFAETILKMRVPYAVIPPEQKEAVTEKTAAVLRKHGGGMPEWLVPYREELELGIVLASAGFGVWMQVQAYKQAEAEAAKAAEAEKEAA